MRAAVSLRQPLVLLCFWVVYGTAESASRRLDSLASTDAADEATMDSAVSLLEVTPQIPDGPVVQQYQKMVEKKKLSAEIERQKTLMGPILARGDAKKLAKKREMEMLAEVEIKNRLGRRELDMKKKAKVEDQVAEARFQAANARRLERYEKWEHDKVVRNKERLGKLRKHTQGAFDMAKKLFQRKASTKKTAMKSMAEAKAEQKQELRMGGYLQLKGDQINFAELNQLNDKLAAAMEEPNEANIKFASDAYDEAAKAVSVEQQGYDAKEQSWKDAEKKEQEKNEERESKIHDEKLEKLKQKINQEKAVKAARKLKIEEDANYNEVSEKKKWKEAYDDIKTKRAKMIAAEKSEKDKFTKELETKEIKKKEAAPGEFAAEKKKKYTERSEKYSGASGGDESTKYIAKRMKMRACEAMEHADMMLKVFSAKGGLKGKKAVDMQKFQAESNQKVKTKCKAPAGFSETQTVADLDQQR